MTVIKETGPLLKWYEGKKTALVLVHLVLLPKPANVEFTISIVPLRYSQGKL